MNAVAHAHLDDRTRRHRMRAHADVRREAVNNRRRGLPLTRNCIRLHIIGRQRVCFMIVVCALVEVEIEVIEHTSQQHTLPFIRSFATRMVL